MPLLEFETCRQRIYRGDVHREAFANAWNQMSEEHYLYGSSIDIKHDGTGSLSVFPARDIPNILALELGEMLYQYRAALDACIYASAVSESGKNPPPNEDKLEWPFTWSDDHFDSASGKIAPLPDDLKAVIKSVQPYKVPKNLAPEELTKDLGWILKILNDWARKDRHRRLHLVASWVSNIQPLFRFPNGVSLKSIEVRSEGFLERQTEIATFTLAGYSEGMKVEANPNLAIDISLDEIPPPLFADDTLGERCAAMSRAVGVIVKAFEKRFMDVKRG